MIPPANDTDAPPPAAFDFDELDDVELEVVQERVPKPGSLYLLGEDGAPVYAQSTVKTVQRSRHSSRAISLPELHQRLAEMQVVAKARAEAEASHRAFEDRDHPEPPTLDPVLRGRARIVWVRMRSHGLWHAPWHHEEIWVWAGSTEDGQAWLQREVARWEVWVEHADLKVRLTMTRLCEEGAGLSDGTTIRTLGKKLQRSRESTPTLRRR